MASDIRNHANDLVKECETLEDAIMWAEKNSAKHNNHLLIRWISPLSSRHFYVEIKHSATNHL